MIHMQATDTMTTCKKNIGPHMVASTVSWWVDCIPCLHQMIEEKDATIERLSKRSNV